MSGHDVLYDSWGGTVSTCPDITYPLNKLQLNSTVGASLIRTNISGPMKIAGQNLP